jgi:hypothetical protein
MDEQNQEYRSTGTSQGTPAPEKKQTGSIIGSIIVVIVILIGGLYFWGTTNKTDTIDPTIDPETGEPVQDIIGDALREQGTADDLDTIESDLNATDINSIDADVESIE